MTDAAVLAYLPSPSTGVWNLGPFPVRAYALAIITGVVITVVTGERRWVARGGTRGVITDVATIAVPAGIVGARLYHVVTSPAAYLEDPVSALYLWKGGLGIPGGIAVGFLAGWLVCRRRGLSAGALADSIAPGAAVAQAVGRLGNWFNSELFGRPTTLPWGLEIDPSKPGTVPGAQAYHPTFLYELLWNLGVAGLVLWADRRYKLGHGRAFALYVGAYAVGRLWIERLRIDPANAFFGIRVNEYVMVLVLLGALGYLYLRRRSGREVRVEGLLEQAEGAADTEADTAEPVEVASVRTGDTGLEDEPRQREGEP